MMLAAALLTVGLAGTAAAAPPSECAGEREKRGYMAGEYTGGAIVDRAWLTVGMDADRVEDLTDAVVNAVGIVSGMFAGSSYGECRLQGFLDGAWARLWKIQQEEMMMCFVDGRLWGRIVGALYCSLSEDLDGLVEDLWIPRPPTTWCGIHFEAGCDQKFRRYTRNQCRDYTVCPYRAVWNEFRNNNCMY
jgi:hypothetical protein